MTIADGIGHANGPLCLGDRFETNLFSDFRTAFPEEFKKLCPDGPGRGEKGEDLNECALIREPCSGGGMCVNTDGSYRCECPPGFILDASLVNCVDRRSLSKASVESTTGAKYFD
ncbi:unnamed protein product [Notodromas monacha]|uniref:EGF-like domain-containing protein n=1 Tax=Notodromas monacha TaxID=399045 RepID=A0A7R9BEJ1_9CRUS|nr:unnamed protein product [Notodromas monacha]CAG0912310.1 unnamed protein product [Notodromas monacha]